MSPPTPCNLGSFQDLWLVWVSANELNHRSRYITLGLAGDALRVPVAERHALYAEKQ